MPNRSPDRSSCDDKLAHILHAAAGVIAEKGYDGTSIRDISRASGVSPAGLYCYFRSKEELLLMIPDRSFGTVLDRLEARLAGVADPRARSAAAGGEPLAVLRHQHDRDEGLAHESGTLAGAPRPTVDAKKRRYRELCQEIVAELNPEPHGLRRASPGTRCSGC